MTSPQSPQFFHQPAWAVAAAVMIGRQIMGPTHYAVISEMVVATGLSALGRLNGKTPSQSMGKMMRDHTDIFCSHGLGEYSVLPDACQNGKVANVLTLIRGQDQGC